MFNSKKQFVVRRKKKLDEQYESEESSSSNDNDSFLGDSMNCDGKGDLENSSASKDISVTKKWKI